MDAARFLSILGNPSTRDLGELNSLARDFAKKYHPDRNNGENHPDYPDFSIAWDVLKKIRNENGNFEAFEFRLREETRSKIEGSEKNYDPMDDLFGWESEDSIEVEEPEAAFHLPIKGDDIKIRYSINIEDAIDGCGLLIEIPRESAKFNDLSTPIYSYNLEPLQVIFDADGKATYEFARKLFNKKLTIKGYGKPGYYGGKNGDLIVTFKFNEDIESVFPDGKKDYKKNYLRSIESIRNAITLMQEPIPQSSESALSGWQYFSPNPGNWNLKERPKNYKNTVYAVIFFIFGFWLITSIQENSQRNREDEIAWDICSYVEDIRQDLVLDAYYSYSNPYAAALQDLYFNPLKEYPEYIGFENDPKEPVSFYTNLANSLTLDKYDELKMQINQMEERISQKNPNYGKNIEWIVSKACNYQSDNYVLNF
jgi:curved DNA-binding protein CbpA